MTKEDKRCKYPLDLKLKIIAYYRKGKVGYIKTARAFNVPRDTTQEWILNQDIIKEEADQLLQEAQKIKKNGGQYCNCEACGLSLEILSMLGEEI